MVEFLEIDGGRNEGGGQIVRSSVALSCITRKPIHINNIRRGRKIAGLRPQHVAAINILEKISGAKVSGAKIGSTELKFIPGKAEKKTTIDQSIGTAGSIPLILQVLMPVAALAPQTKTSDLDNGLNITIRGGGTDVPWSPSMDYITHVLGKAYSKMGMNFSLKVKRRGYYPRGGGVVTLHMAPSNLNAVTFLGKRTKKAEITCTFSQFKEETIHNEINKISKYLPDYTINKRVIKDDAVDSGASMLVYNISDGRIVGVDSLSDKKRSRWQFDTNKFRESLGVDDNLADMLALPASVCDGVTKFHVKNITKHLETNLYVVSKITGCRYGIGRLEDMDGFEILIDGVSYPCI